MRRRTFTVALAAGAALICAAPAGAGAPPTQDGQALRQLLPAGRRSRCAKGTTVKWKWPERRRSTSTTSSSRRGPKGAKQVPLRARLERLHVQAHAEEAGTYKIVCTLHEEMKMTIRVKPAEQLRLLRLELVLAEDAAVAQVGEPVEAVDERVAGGRRARGRGRLDGRRAPARRRQLGRLDCVVAEDPRAALDAAEPDRGRRAAGARRRRRSRRPASACPAPRRGRTGAACSCRRTRRWR